MISESKLNDSFPHGQFLIDGFQTPFILDRNKNGGRILLYVWEDNSSKISSLDFPPAESFLLKQYFTKRNGLYNWVI